MNIKLSFAILNAKLLIKTLRLLKKGGTTLPGKVALKLYPNIGKVLSKNYNIIMVTGTNGKTTTTRIISKMLEENGIKYITNKSGANLVGGIITTLIESVNLSGKSSYGTALLEIDEAAFAKITPFIKPNYLVVTNFFRDQLDRYGELYTTLNGVKQGLTKCDFTTVILNADDSLCASIGKDLPNPSIHYGFSEAAYSGVLETANSDAMFCMYCKTKYEYNSHVYGHLGTFSCPSCGYSRPETIVTCEKVNELSTSSSNITFSIGKDADNVVNDATVNLPGLYNIYNALAAAALGHALDLPIKNTINAMGSFECGFGRMETIEANGKFIKLILVKNPTGFNQVLNFLITEQKEMNLAFIINDNLADGTDISWLWDVDFEKLLDVEKRVNNFLTSGIRAEDMAVRLKYAGIEASNINICHDYDELLSKGLDSIKEGETFYILPTYTSMLEIREIMAKKYGLKEFWK